MQLIELLKRHHRLVRGVVVRAVHARQPKPEVDEFLLHSLGAQTAALTDGGDAGLDNCRGPHGCLHDDDSFDHGLGLRPLPATRDQQSR